MTTPRWPELPLPKPDWTVDELRDHYALKPLPNNRVVEARVVQTWARLQAVARWLVEDELAFRAAIRMQVELLYEQLATVEGCKWAGEPVISLHDQVIPTIVYDDPRSLLRRLWDRIRRRTWTPPPPPYALRVEVRAA